MTRVLAAPLFDPGAGRIVMDVPEGMTVGQIVGRALPQLPTAERAQLRVALATSAGSTVVYPALWHAIRPRPGVQVVIRVIPAGDSLRSILSIVVSVAAVAMGNVWGAQFGQFLGLSATTGRALLTLGLNVLGSLALNALIPPAKPDEQRKSYAIQGWRNRLEPDGAVPVVLGAHRYAPPFAAMSYTEIVGDWQYVRAVFVAGYGPLQLSDFRLGETSLDEYDEVEIETRAGLPSDEPITLYPQQVLEEAIGVELTRPLPRDDQGDVIDRAPIVTDPLTGQLSGGGGVAAKETPVVRTSAGDAASASVIFQFPAGLVSFDKKGKKRSRTVEVRIRQRLAGTEPWTPVQTLRLVGKATEAFYRQHSWTFPTRGRWEIELTRLTDETDDAQVSDRVVWAALQSIRPEYPLAFTSPLALVALRIKATHQINGSIDNLSCLCARSCLDYDHETGAWVERVTSNPASIYRYVLTSPANPRPIDTAQIDLQQLEAWHDFCRLKGLTYNRVLDEAGTTLRDVLAEIAAAGRASPRHDGLRWGVTIDDTADDLIVDEMSPRNSSAFSTTRAYVEPPHGFRVKFLDATNDYRPAERLVPWPGHQGEITLTEALELPGKTDPAEVWREARRRMYEAIYRPDSYQLTQPDAVRVATRGDRVALSHDVLDEVQIAARVVGRIGSLIEIDERVSITADQSYAIRWRTGLTSADTIGRSVVRRVWAHRGETSLLTLEGSGDVPEIGDLVMFGRAGLESRTLIVTGVEATEDAASLIRLIDLAPEIDQLLAADTPPPWSGRAGVDLPVSQAAPPVPRFAGVDSGVAGTGEAGVVIVQLRPGSGTVPTAAYRLQHKASGASSWAFVEVAAADGAARISGYARDATVDLAARALSASGAASDPTPTITITVGDGDAALPVALPAADITVTPLLGGATVEFATSADSATTEVHLFVASVPTLDRAAHAAGVVAVTASRTFAATIGDGTRRNLLQSADFASATGWTLGAGWAVSGGQANRSATAAVSSLSQPVTLTPGTAYRLAGQVTRSAGSLTAQLTGSTPQSGAARTSSGRWRDQLTAVTGNGAVAWSSSADFAGSLDDVVAYPETPACLPQGVNYVWLEPRNADGLAGPLTGPIIVTID